MFNCVCFPEGENVLNVAFGVSVSSGIRDVFICVSDVQLFKLGLRRCAVLPASKSVE